MRLSCRSIPARAGVWFIECMSVHPDRSGPERLRVYDLSLQLVDSVNSLLARARCSRSLRVQLQRCSESVVLNIAEGAAHFGARQKAHFYRIARASTGECIGGLDLLARRDRRLDIHRARHIAAMTSLMLARLIARHEPIPPQRP
jgi:four helix bundle protein